MKNSFNIITRYPDTHAVVVPSFNNTPISKETPKEKNSRIKQSILYVLGKLVIVVVLIIIAILLSLGSIKLDTLLGTGQMIYFFTCLITGLLGIIASQIIFE